MMRNEQYSWWVRLLLFGYALLSVAGWLRMGRSIANWYWLDQAGLTPGPLYLVLTGALWGMLGVLACAWILRRLRRWRVVGLATALVFAASYWIDRLFVAEPQGNLSNTAFAVLVTLFCLGLSTLALREAPARK